MCSLPSVPDLAFVLDVLTLKDETSALSQMAKIQLPTDMTLYSRKTEISSMLLQKPKKSRFLQFLFSLGQNIIFLFFPCLWYGKMYHHYAIIAVEIAESIKSVVLEEVMCSVMYSSQCFGGTSCFHLQGRMLEAAGPFRMLVSV